GLLWGWRMFTDAWRGNPGWSEEGLPKFGAEPSRAIVLFTSGNTPSWKDLEGKNSSAPWETTRDPFTFSMDFYWCEQPCKTNKLITHSHTEPLSNTKNGWQRPITSLAMKHPLKSPLDETGGKKREKAEDHINFSTWPQIAELTQGTCDAIKADNIEIYVLSTSYSTDTVLRECASSNAHFYQRDQIDSLLQNLRSRQTSSSSLRLVR